MRVALLFLSFQERDDENEMVRSFPVAKKERKQGTKMTRLRIIATNFIAALGRFNYSIGPDR